ncbi:MULTISPECIES: hypothetical protein [unclassified Haematospirillum]|uniref:hypothetical protein n=1 Tax=unclassified Haematospirillum TaxID=2622088 RepID=UPI00143A4064|nr:MULTISPECIES: hypothetical protein [unclassified Haematospirillum]NKD55905.1 hypothetical protein [Haematospirillum sp. H4890]NKD75965.1 hypothetical protein [Haematospirillum sp. H4485]
MPFLNVADLPETSFTTNKTRPAFDFARHHDRSPISAKLFARTVGEQCHDANRQRIASLIGVVRPEEIDALVHRAADLKARYLSAVLDSGKARGAPRPGQHDELGHLRSALAEAEQGLETIRNSIMRGELFVDGVNDGFP